MWPEPQSISAFAGQPGVLVTKGLMRHEIIEHALGKGVAQDVDAVLVATSTVSAVRLVLRELKLVVGELAACALYKRSVHLARSSFQRPSENASSHDELLAPLHQDLAGRSSIEAQKGGRALLTALVDLLVSLIGEPLTHQMLRKAWGIPSDSLISEEKPK